MIDLTNPIHIAALSLIGITPEQVRVARKAEERRLSWRIPGTERRTSNRRAGERRKP